MDNQQPHTTEHTSTQQIATKGQRIVAFAIDALIVSAISWIFGGLSGFIIFAVYMLTRDAWPFLNGVSIGKKLMKIRAVDADGHPLTNNWELSAKRNILLLGWGLGALIEGVMLIINDEDQRLGDQWFQTRVIQDETL